MQEKALNEIMVGKTCNRLVSVLENKNCNEGLGTKPILKMQWQQTQIGNKFS